jgi:hypothetical protein
MIMKGSTVYWRNDLYTSYFFWPYHYNEKPEIINL